jgi:predicted GNAT family acetyltransferase
MRHVAGAVQARGETPFLHAYAGNTGAIGLYESLGFLLRTPLTVSVLNPA